jgi:hypothetical protein
MVVKSKITLTIFTAGVIFLLGSIPAPASTYSFYSITNNTLANVEIGMAQLSVEVTDPSSDQVLFTFWNTGDDACSIAEVYFDDGFSLVGEPELIDKNNAGDPDVDFVTLANPPNLPGWDTADPVFEVTAAFTTQASNPAPHKGVNPGEFLGILFDLQEGYTLDDVLDELYTGELRIGLHVTGFDLGDGESFINNPIATPIPATVWIFGAGVVGLIGIRRKLSR